MSLNRYAAKRDRNEPEIVEALRLAGCRVVHTDVFDLIVQRGRLTYLLEVKTPQGRPTKSQARLKADGWRVHVVHSADEAFRAVGLLQATQ
ncbi:MAG: hypothetical protein KGL39_58385 [Patescibacteria group bacterium]|nr:hypothetical protein [Patescibacteria group bacterium]